MRLQISTYFLFIGWILNLWLEIKNRSTAIGDLRNDVSGTLLFSFIQRVYILL